MVGEFVILQQRRIGMDKKIKLLIDILTTGRVKRSELLKDHLFTKMGGPADYLYIATTTFELVQAISTVKQLKIPFLLIGQGTKTALSAKGFRGLVIKNRTHTLKISGIKGKIGVTGIGVEEALVEVDSGVSLLKLNSFLTQQNLEKVTGYSSMHSSIGGSIFTDLDLQNKTQKLKIWRNGEKIDINFPDLSRSEDIVLSVIIKAKSRD